MNLIKQFLQNPFIKIFISPLSSIMFGLLIGASQAQTIQWLPMVWLYLIVFSAQLIDHYLYIRLDRNADNAAPRLLFYLFEIMLLFSSIMLMLSSHWVINLLLVFYIIFIHIQYYPFKMTGTLYHFLLAVFFQGFVMNIIAYNSQTFAITEIFMINLIPVVLIMIVMNLEVFNLKHLLIHYRFNRYLEKLSLLPVIIGFIAMGLGFYLTIPSASFYIVQILFIGITCFLLLPLLVRTPNEQQAQNKMNYMHAVAVIFSLLYGLSHIF